MKNIAEQQIEDEKKIQQRRELTRERSRRYQERKPCAITIHKPQEVSLNEVVYKYEKTHSQSLVYVALSRATRLEGLYIVTENSDPKFFHGLREWISLRDLQSEFERSHVLCFRLDVDNKTNDPARCRGHLYRTEYNLRLVLFGDESRFSLDGDSEHFPIWKEPGSRYRISDIVKQDNYGRSILMVWKCIMTDRHAGIHAFDNGTLKINGAERDSCTLCQNFMQLREKQFHLYER
ncbi:reverse transcriptase domain-containing protein [Trichonephila clavipes]|nr:reverse transcriptase domain-containing protein [Trichonephila clavipes]